MKKKVLIFLFFIAFFALAKTSYGFDEKNRGYIDLESIKCSKWEPSPNGVDACISCKYDCYGDDVNPKFQFGFNVKYEQSNGLLNTNFGIDNRDNVLNTYYGLASYDLMIQSTISYEKIMKNGTLSCPKSVYYHGNQADTQNIWNVYFYLESDKQPKSRACYLDESWQAYIDDDEEPKDEPIEVEVPKEIYETLKSCTYDLYKNNEKIGEVKFDISSKAPLGYYRKINYTNINDYRPDESYSLCNVGGEEVIRSRDFKLEYDNNNSQCPNGLFSCESRVWVFRRLYNSNNIIGEKIDYEHFCDDVNVKNAVRIIGYILRVLTFIGPLIMIILAIIDFAKVVPSSDEKALNKAAMALARRFIASVLVFLAQPVLFALLSFLGVTGGIESENNKAFGNCTVCLLKPGECKITTSNQ